MTKLEELIKEMCPNGVEYKTVGNVSHVERGTRITKKDLIDDGQYVVISGGTSPMGRYNKYNRNPNTITVSSYGQAGYVDLVTTYFWANDVCLCIFPQNMIINKYLYYCLKNKQEYLYSKTTKAIPDHLPTDVLIELSIPVPPIPVQEEIVRILDSFTELAAELTAELTARKKQYEYYRDSLLTISNEKIAMSRLDSIAKFTYGYTDKAKDSGSVRFIRITDISDNGILNPNDAKFIDLTDESKKYLLHKGDIVMARTGATFGKTLYVPDDTPSVYASFLIKITLDNSKISNRFYWHFAQSNLYWEQANKLVSAGGQPQFNASAVGRVLVPVPPLETQNKIVQVLDNFDSICSDLKIGLPAEIEARRKQYEYYRDLLLSFASDCSQSVSVERERERERERESERESRGRAER